MRNVIYVGARPNSSVVAGAAVPLATIDKKYNRCGACSRVDLTGDAVAIETTNKRPRYNAFATITFTGASAGDASFAVYKNNALASPLAVASATITTPTTEIHTVTIPLSILTDCCSTTALTIVNTGTIGVTVVNASLLVIED